ncbi:hypothetical protein [Nocardia altamirensis]|uniref:hypothetical protein n=1 Tax=Nocardia altamirensis TaxID=472158 RepID=UPI0008400CA7|nr:hypothetical protein [Nocardia altamirensis]
MTAPVRYQPLAAAPTARAEIGQATAVEQSRAVAEVQAAVFVAQQRPRNKSVAVEEMRDATAQMAVAQKAYFRYRRGTEQVTGASIHLARELARCWGNIDYGVKELRRDDDKGESEMLAYAWDLQTNSRSATTFIVPHIRDTKQGARKLTETRDIYENNANAGARRLREMIFNVMPSWFTEEAKTNCDTTLENGGGQPLTQRIANAIKGFEAIGVTRAQLDDKIGRPSNDWNGHDVGQLSTIYQSIKRGETSIDDEFPTPAQTQLTAEEISKAGRRRKTEKAPETTDLAVASAEPPAEGPDGEQ